jgi:hypothetical protein
MIDVHPKLCSRPQPRPGAKRPTLGHAVLGALEYVNRDGGWWQGTAAIGGVAVRLDLQQPANPAADAVQSAAESLQWVQENEATIRGQIGARLAAAEYHAAGRGEPEPIADAAALLPALRPMKVVLWRDHAELYYDCALLPDGNLRGAHQVGVFLDAERGIDITLDQLELDRRAANLLGRPVPAELVDFVDSLADQFLARAATGGIVLDAELTDLLETAIAEIEPRRARAGSATAGDYLTSVANVLRAIHSLKATAIERLIVDVRVRHPAGKRMPIKQKLNFAPDDRARFDGSGAFPRIELFDLGRKGLSREAFADVLQSRWRQASAWLTRQSPASFQDMRDAGFDTHVFVYVVARIGMDSVAWGMPAEFLAACGRLGLDLSTATSNSASW